MLSESRPNFKRKKDTTSPSRPALFSSSGSNYPIEIRSSEPRLAHQVLIYRASGFASF